MKIIKRILRVMIAIAFAGLSGYQFINYGETYLVEETFLSVLLGSAIVIPTFNKPENKKMVGEIQEFFPLIFDYVTVFMICGILFGLPNKYIIELAVGQIAAIFLYRYGVEKLKGIRIVFALSIYIVSSIIVAYSSLGAEYVLLISLLLWNLMYFIYKHENNDVA